MAHQFGIFLRIGEIPAPGLLLKLPPQNIRISALTALQGSCYLLRAHTLLSELFPKLPLAPQGICLHIPQRISGVICESIGGEEREHSLYAAFRVIQSAQRRPKLPFRMISAGQKMERPLSSAFGQLPAKRLIDGIGDLTVRLQLKLLPVAIKDPDPGTV